MGVDLMIAKTDGKTYMAVLFFGVLTDESRCSPEDRSTVVSRPVRFRSKYCIMAK